MIPILPAPQRNGLLSVSALRPGAAALNINNNSKPPLALLETGLFGIGILLLLVYAAAQAFAVVGSEQAVASFRLAQAEAESRQLDASVAVDTALWSANRIESYEKTLSVELLPPEALLHIPGIDLTVPVFAGTAETYLSRGVGHIEGTAGIGAGGNRSMC